MNKIPRLVTGVAVVDALLGTLGLGYWWGHSRSGGADAIPPASIATSGERRPLYWYDPMVPDQHFDKPGKSPFMDMQLLPKYADEASAGRCCHRAGRAAEPGPTDGSGEARAIGLGHPRARHIGLGPAPGTHCQCAGRCHRRTPIRENALRSGARRATVGQPDRASLGHGTGRSAGAASGGLRIHARALQSAANQRLHALGMPAGAGRGGRIVLSSPVNGVVSEIGVREGQSAPIGTLLFRINGNRSLWLEAAVAAGRRCRH